MTQENNPQGKKPSRRFSLAATFSNAARRRLSKVMLGAALLTGTGNLLPSPAQAALPPSDTTTHTQTITPQETPFGQLVPSDSLYRAEIRQILLRDAQRRFPELLDHAETPYSQQLQVLQDSLNVYLSRTDTTMHNAIIVLDPARIDAAISLGMPVREAIRAEVERHGRGNLPEGALAAASRNAAAPYISEAGVPVHTQNPSAYPNMDSDEARPCLIIPASDHAHLYNVPGMTTPQKIEFTNRHEGWHCLDSRYRMTEAQMTALGTLNPYDFEAFADNPDLVAAASVIHHKEALADIAALGDMIRSGHDMALIDHAIAWRQDNVSQDYLHYSVPGLKRLKAYINDMGLDAFRAMAPGDVQELYFAINDAEALTPPQLQAMAAYLLADPEERPALGSAAEAGSDAARGIAYAEEVLKPSTTMPRALRDLIAAFAPPDTTLRRQLIEWAPIDRLEQGAIDRDGRITPETLIRSYSALQTELHGQLFGDDARLAREKMALLKGVFVRYLRTVDYVAANAEYGVDIEVAEKELIARGRAETPQIIALPRLPAPPERIANDGAAQNLQSGCGCPKTGYHFKGPR